jgi:CHAD domain-containing protein
VKARKVKLDPDGPVGESILAILSVRLDELYSFDPGEPGDLHDMRIAAKRVRYILEAAEPVFGQPATRGVKTMRRLQDLLGEIHDCDELLPLVERHVAKLRNEDAAAAAAGAPLPNRRKYRGLEALRAHTVADRERLYARFTRKWAKLERDAFRARLEVELARAGVPT